MSISGFTCELVSDRNRDSASMRGWCCGVSLGGWRDSESQLVGVSGGELDILKSGSVSSVGGASSDGVEMVVDADGGESVGGGVIAESTIITSTPTISFSIGT